MDCKSFRELAPAMVLGALDESEHAACAAHLASAGPHDGCREAEAEARAVAARLSNLLPDHPVNPRVWRAIEERIGAPMPAPDAPPEVAGSRRALRRWRELAGWIVAATILGVHLCNAPVNHAGEVGAGDMSPGARPGAATATPTTMPAATVTGTASPSATPPALKSALTLMMGPNTRRYVFQSKPPGTARATLIVDASLRTAVVLADHVVPGPGEGLRLWAVRTQGGAAAVGFLTRIGNDDGGVAAAEVGTALFDPALPGTLWLSADPPDAAAPRSVLMVANLGDGPGD